MGNLEIVIKMTAPFYLYLFYRSFFYTKYNIDGLFFTYLVSCALPFGLLLFEVMISPFKVEFSRNVPRLMGGYADVSNLMMYFCFGLIIEMIAAST